MKSGDFKKQKLRNQRRQKIWDAAKRAHAGEDVWVTVEKDGALYRCRLKPGNPLDYYNPEYHGAQCSGCSAWLFNQYGKPTFAELDGKNGRVLLYNHKNHKSKYCSDGCRGHHVADTKFFKDICLAGILEYHKIS